MSLWERRRRPLDGEQLFNQDVEVVQVVDVVTKVVYVDVAIVIVKVLISERIFGELCALKYGWKGFK